MKHVLFVIQSIGFGGSMTSLINLLGFLKRDQNFSIDVLIMDKYGELLEQAEEVANVLPENRILQAVSATRDKLKRYRRYDLIATRCYFAVKARVAGKTTENLAFDYAAKSISGKYDCVIAYQESIATKFVSYIQAKRKIAWVHNDFENVCHLCGGLDAMNQLYSSFDKIVCVSKAGQRNFRSGLNFGPKNIEYIYNTLNQNVIREKAIMPVEEMISKDSVLYQKLLQHDVMKFVSSGRFVNQKRFDRVVHASKLLKLHGEKFVWFILGDGQLYDEIAKMISDEGLEEYVYLTGSLKNPFPFINCCDVFVLTSDFEAHPMVANEALILNKPVITTSFESAKEVVLDKKNGLICDMNPESIADACAKLIRDKNFLSKLQSEASQFQYENDTIINKVKILMGE